MLLGRYKQQPGERLKRILDYTQWLETTELITNVTTEIDNETNTPFEVSSTVIDPGGKKFAYYLQGGEDGETYKVTFTVTTQAQVRQDEIEIDVEDV